ncbi:MAG TPA: polysaccharide deacetylase family protein [Candidatus Hydrogenedentes bacterium]|nr:polysaccharide deacetylase family protein [Candidatus Hydrogenedentota bacterium]
MDAGPRLKAAVKRALKHGAAIPGKVVRCAEPCLRILTYHSVGTRKHDMNVAPEDFRAQMEWLAASHEVLPLAAGVEAGRGIAVTFDDGYRDNLTNAAPVLQALGIPATVFVVTGRLGQTLDLGDHAGASGLMTWDEVREIRRMGVLVGAHTVSHRRLAALNEAEQRAEIEGAARHIEQHLGQPAAGFAYPFGAAADYNALSVRIVRECGFPVAASNRYGGNRPGADRWQLRRIWIDATDTLPTFKAKVNGELDLLALLDSRVGLWCRRAFNRSLGIR